MKCKRLQQSSHFAPNQAAARGLRYRRAKMYGTVHCQGSPQMAGANAREFQWTPAAVETVRTLLVDQHQTRQQAADHLGVSRGALKDAVHRHLPSLICRREIVEKKPKPTPQRTAKFFPDQLKSINPHATAGSALKDLKPESSKFAVGWVDFRPHCQCHWPVNAAPFLFCGRTKLKTSAYCKSHFKRSLAPPR